LAARRPAPRTWPIFVGPADGRVLGAPHLSPVLFGAIAGDATSAANEMSVTAGTIFHDSHRPLTIWFRAVWQVRSQKYGISALGLQRVLGLGS
jgi:hypothetical protein